MPPMFCRSMPKVYVPENAIPARVRAMQENLRTYERNPNENNISLVKEMFIQGMSKHEIAMNISK